MRRHVANRASRAARQPGAEGEPKAPRGATRIGICNGTSACNASQNVLRRPPRPRTSAGPWSCRVDARGGARRRAAAASVPGRAAACAVPRDGSGRPDARRAGQCRGWAGRGRYGHDAAGVGPRRTLHRDHASGRENLPQPGGGDAYRRRPDHRRRRLLRMAAAGDDPVRRRAAATADRHRARARRAAAGGGDAGPRPRRAW